jgi:hypothetical protein
MTIHTPVHRLPSTSTFFHPHPSPPIFSLRQRPTSHVWNPVQERGGEYGLVIRADHAEIIWSRKARLISRHPKRRMTILDIWIGTADDNLVESMLQILIRKIILLSQRQSLITSSRSGGHGDM